MLDDMSDTVKTDAEGNGTPNEGSVILRKVEFEVRTCEIQ
jgi:hypothetical protein